MAIDTFNGVFFAGAALAVSTSSVPAAGNFVLAGRKEACTRITVQTKTTGSPTSYSVTIQGSIDGQNWDNIGSAITADGVSSQTNSGKFYLFVRGNITAVSGGTSPTITQTWVADS